MCIITFLRGIKKDRISTAMFKARGTWLKKHQASASKLVHWLWLSSYSMSNMSASKPQCASNKVLVWSSNSNRGTASSNFYLFETDKPTFTPTSCFDWPCVWRFSLQLSFSFFKHVLLLRSVCTMKWNSMNASKKEPAQKCAWLTPSVPIVSSFLAVMARFLFCV